MAGNLHGKRIAILATDGFEQVEFIEPRRKLNEVGATTEVVAPKELKSAPGNSKSGATKSRSTKASTMSAPRTMTRFCFPAG